MARRGFVVATLGLLAAVAYPAWSSFSDGFFKEAGKDIWKLASKVPPQASAGYWATESYNPGYMETDSYNPGHRNDFQPYKNDFQPYTKPKRG